jgi:NAD(P)-dependent dehydrogenase (short-subunit alcohol dehydrogenase family)
VTGAGSGIGAASTLALAAQGVDVVAVSRRPERLLSDTGSAVSNLHVAAARARLTLEPPGGLHERILRYQPSDWERISE